MKNRFLKTLTSLVLAIVMVATLIPAMLIGAFAADVAGTSVKYIFSDYTAGTQYAVNEVHRLDDTITVTTTEAHFTTQLRLYSSSAHNGFAIIRSAAAMDSIVLNAGNEADTLNVYSSTDGTTWSLVKGVATKSSYADYTVDLPNDTTYIKLDVDGSKQVRVASMTITFTASSGGDEPCTHPNKKEVAPAVAPTCGEPGSTASYMCPDCEEIWESEEIPATGDHVNTETIDEGFAATCKDAGITECGEAEPTVTKYELVTDVTKLSVGSKIIIVANGSAFALSTTQNTNNRAQIAITKNGNFIELIDGIQVLTLEEGTKDGTFALNTGSGYLYAASGSSNHLKTQTTLNDNGSWTITIDTNGVATVKAQGTNSRNWLRYNASNNPPMFSCYGSGQSDIAIYKLACSHTNKTSVAAQAPTCTEIGWDAYQVCGDCGEKIGYTELPAKGHTKETVPAQAATCQAAGWNEHEKCSVCEETFGYEAEPINPGNHVGNEGGICTGCGDSICTEHTFGEWDVTPATCTEDGEQTRTCSVCGSTETETLDATGHTIVIDEAVAPTCTATGLTEGEHCSACDHKVEQTVIPATGHKYTNGVCTACGNLQPLYQKVTEAPADWSGTYLIVYNGEEGAFAFNGSLGTLDNENNGWGVTIADGKILGNLSQYVFTITKVDGGYTIQSASGFYIGKTASGNGLNTSETEAYVNTISVDADGNAVITASGGSTLRFNSNSNQMRFRYYGSGQQSIALYKMTEIDLPVLDTWSLSLKSDIGFNLYCVISDALIKTYPDAQIVLSTGASYAFNNLEAFKTSDGRYLIKCAISPDKIGSVITFEVIVNGTAILTETASVEAYVDAILGMNASDLGMDDTAYGNLLELLDALMIYGSAAEHYVAGTAGDTITSALDTWLSDKTATADSIWTEVSATLSSTVALNYYFTLGDELPTDYIFSATALLVGETKPLASGQGLQYFAEDTGKTNADGKKIYRLSIGGFVASDFDVDVTLSISKRGSEESTAATLSIIDYACELLGRSENAQTSNLVNALYNYYCAAKDYFG